MRPSSLSSGVAMLALVASRIPMDGAPWFDLVITRLEVASLLVEPLLAGPPRSP